MFFRGTQNEKKRNEKTHNITFAMCGQVTICRWKNLFCFYESFRWNITNFPHNNVEQSTSGTTIRMCDLFMCSTTRHHMFMLKVVNVGFFSFAFVQFDIHFVYSFMQELFFSSQSILCTVSQQKQHHKQTISFLVFRNYSFTTNFYGQLTSVSV